jgi:predicted MFS family arabinose efflux permease
VTQPPVSAAQEWRENWTLVLSAAIGFSFMSIMTTSMGAFIGPLVREFHWSRTVVSMGLPIAGVVSVLLSPFVGMFIDRRGPRRLAIPGLAAMMLCTASFGLANGSVAQWVGLWVVYALVTLAVTVNVWSAAVARAFTAGRGLALGLVLAGTAVAQAAAPVVSTWLIEHYGWRAAFPTMAVAWGGFAFILCLLFFRSPTDGQERGEARDTSALPGLTVAQAWRDPGLWRIAISTFLLMVLTIGLLIHQIPILIEAGVTADRAALLAGAGGLAGVVGKLVTGVLVDRFRANWVGGVTLGFAALAFLLLIDGVRSPALIIVAMLINGYSAGTKLQICSYLTARYGGLRKFGTIYGFISSLVSLGSALGPLLAGVVYDRTGSYDLFLVAGTAGCLFCGLLIVTLPRYPDWSAGEAVSDSTLPDPARA